MRRLKCILLTLALMLSVVTVISADEGYSVDIDISDLLFDDTVEEVSLSTPAFSDMDLVAENENATHIYYQFSSIHFRFQKSLILLFAMQPHTYILYDTFPLFY